MSQIERKNEENERKPQPPTNIEDQRIIHQLKSVSDVLDPPEEVTARNKTRFMRLLRILTNQPPSDKL